MDIEYIFTFSSTNHAILGESLLLAQSLPVKVMPLPGVIQAGCGLCLRLPPAHLELGRTTLAQGNVPLQGIYQRTLGQGLHTIEPYKEN